VKTKADIVVVGAGSSGAVVAARLAEAGADVVLLEAGPDYGPFGSKQWPPDLLNAHAIALSHDWGYGSGDVEGRAPWTFERAKVMGGCSSHNGAIAAVGHASDYDAWGLSLWKTELLRPLFAVALEKMRVRAYAENEAGPFHALCLDAARSLGWSIASDLCDLDANESFGLETVNIVNGTRWNTGFGYIDAVRHLTNLSITDMTEVERIVEHGSGAIVVAWRYGQPVTIDCSRVVLSAGVYGTPAILQRSGIGDPARLEPLGIKVRQALRGVGGNLHDHPMIHASRAIGPDLLRQLEAQEANGGLPEEQTLGKACSSLAIDGIFDVHLFPVCASTQTALTNGNAMVEVACMNPKSRGRVDIASTDWRAKPRIDHGYLTDPDGHDLAVLRDGLAMAEELLRQPALASALGPSIPPASSDDEIRRHVMHYYHPVGTCPMGTGDIAVCDEKGSVHGLNRITVADVSLMPQIPRANTNIPAVVIGERVASFLT
jgi:choline dehydrogenase